jgi:hypothetical protein
MIRAEMLISLSLWPVGIGRQEKKNREGTVVSCCSLAVGQKQYYKLGCLGYPINIHPMLQFFFEFESCFDFWSLFMLYTRR